MLAPRVAFDGSEGFAALRLVWCALVLSLFGRAATALASRYCSQSATGDGLREIAPLSQLPYVSRAIITLAIGQLVAMTWVFARSALSGLAYALTGWQLPITTFELLTLVIAAGFIALQSRPKARTRRIIGSACGFICMLVCIIAPLALRDLPRSVALSSDPDQHAFWASQVIKLGIVPWDQGLTGVGPFGYPAGFAVLNAVWMAFSGLSAVAMVTIQPLLQFLLAIATCAAATPLICRTKTAAPEQSESAPGSDRVILLILGALVTYWFALPYGLQTERWHGEGTARLSTALLTTIVVLLWITPWTTHRSARYTLLRLATATAAIALLATVNPLSALIPLCIVGGIVTKVLWLGVRNHHPRSAITAILTAAALGCIIICGEPYFVGAVAKAIITGGTPGGASPSFSNLQNTLQFSSFRAIFSPAHSIPYLSAGIFFRDLSVTAMSTLGLIIVVWMWRTPGPALRWICALWLSVALAMGARVFQSATAGGVPLYLVAPYTYEAALQIGAILGYTLALVLLYSVLSVRRPYAYVGLMITLGLSVWLLTQQHSISATSASFAIRPRKCAANTPYCLSQSDRKALDYLAQLGARIRSEYPHLTYSSAPKIMILGVPKRYDRESWVFPSDASRVVPIYSSLPVAFFYGRGSSEWSFENYSTRVCKRLDVEWLKRRNIRYLFLSKRDHGCMKRRKEVVQNSTILFEDGGVRVVQLLVLDLIDRKIRPDKDAVVTLETSPG